MLSLLAGCNWCPDGYTPCAGHCWRLLDASTDFSSAKALCNAESKKHYGYQVSWGGIQAHPRYIAIPSPRNSAEDVCAYELSGGNGVWLGFVFIPSGFFWIPGKWVDYLTEKEFSYAPWASGEPSWHANEHNIVLIPVQGGLNSGWHNWNEQDSWYTLCATRICIDNPANAQYDDSWFG